MQTASWGEIRVKDCIGSFTALMRAFASMQEEQLSCWQVQEQGPF